MKELEIEFEGGFRRASKFLTRKHGANFAILIDGLIYIYNQNLDKLVQTNDDQYSVKVSNGFLSRATGLGPDIVKRQMIKIEKIGLVTATKKGQGNTKHYTIHVEDINIYIKALESEFKIWFEQSLNYGKKEMSRSIEADKIKEEKRSRNFKATIDNLQKNNVKELNGLVQNQPTKLVKTNFPKKATPTVEERTEERKQDRIIETTTDPKNKIKNIVVNKVFSSEDDKGTYTILRDFNEKKVYQEEYEYFVKRFTDEELETKLEELRNQITEIDLNHIIFDSDEIGGICEDSFLEDITSDDIMMHIYDEICGLTRTFKRKQERERKNTKKPASKEISMSNWNKLKTKYNDLPSLKNQGKFFTSQKDQEDFYNLSEYRQEYVIESVSKMRDAATTASRPAIYIEEAMKDKLGEVYDPHARLSVAL
ncbi:hypothetical protein [Lutimonas vermicola]|uniref:Uncharacterized protein n=1 Tax=Lutimonas vermicola TaxID=414288 RepID=A0ABU9L4M4_9FLAO